MSEKKGKPHAIKLRKLAEAWAREAQDQLEMAAEDIEPVVQAMRDALDRQIGRKAGKLVIGQTANILLYLGPRLNLGPRDEAGRLLVHQLQLAIADLVVLIHDTHHPITGYLYYEQQRAAAKLRTKYFWRYRAPKFLRYFERVLIKSGGPYLLSTRSK